MKEKSKKVLHTYYRSIRASWLSTDQVGLSNNNPHWNLDFRFLFFPDLIQVLRDLKVTHPSLERLESDSSKSGETWKWLIQVSRDLKVNHPSLERLEIDSSKSRETWKWLIQVLRDLKVTHQKNQPYPSPWRVRLRWRCSSGDRYTPLLLQVWKSLHKVCGRLLHPPPLMPCLTLRRAWSERSFYLGKNPSLKTGSITVWQGDWGQGNLSTVCRSRSAWTEGLTRACRDTECLSANKHTDQSKSSKIWVD